METSPNRSADPADHQPYSHGWAPRPDPDVVAYWLAATRALLKPKQPQHTWNTRSGDPKRP